MPEFSGPPMTSDVPRFAHRNQVVQRPLLQQRVAAGEQEGVPVAEAQRIDQHFLLVHADADGGDRAGAAEFLQRLVAAVAQHL